MEANFGDSCTRRVAAGTTSRGALALHGAAIQLWAVGARGMAGLVVLALVEGILSESAPINTSKKGPAKGRFGSGRCAKFRPQGPNKSQTVQSDPGHSFAGPSLELFVCTSSPRKEGEERYYLRQQTDLKAFDRGFRRDREGGHAVGFEEGHAKGFFKGHAEGFDEGRDVGHAEGLAKGFAKGFGKGHEEGQAKGFGKGLKDAHAKGGGKGNEEGHAWQPSRPSTEPY